ncbi:protein aardvark [Anaeramoeba ignava]|uniref:Protein aardvark n=1 Tax=Anaeramoeba ignava TaxID=1746090 RepID=A0A9Q0RE40_ANAIG|nr:protein aardvark [Anaeramoeba ignava]
MNNFPNNQDIQENGCLALRNLTIEEKNRNKIVELKGIEIIIKSMNNFLNNQDIQKYGCLALANIAVGNEKNQNKISELKGIETIIKSINNFPNNFKIHQWGFLTLLNISDNNEENTNEISELKGIEIIIKSMNNFPKVSKIQEYGSKILFNCSFSNKENQMRIKELNGIETIKKAMNIFPNHKLIQKFGILIKFNLNPEDINQNELIIIKGFNEIEKMEESLSSSSTLEDPNFLSKIDILTKKINKMKKEKINKQKNDIWEFDMKMFPSNKHQQFQKIEMKLIEIENENENEYEYENENEFQIKQIVSSTRFKNFLYYNEQLFEESNQNSNKRKKIGIENIKKVSVGFDIETILTREGKVFAKGKRINLNLLNEYIEISELIKDRKEEIIEDIICGKDSVYLLSSKKNVYGIGSNEYGQLGINLPKKVEEPILMKQDIYKIFSGNCSNGVFLLNSKQELFSCGDNKYGQLGLGTKIFSNATSLIQIENIPKGKINDIQMGIFHSIMMIEEENGKRKLYSCGHHLYNGLGENEMMKEFKEIKANLIENDNIKEISVGKYHSLILTTQGKLIGFGQNENENQNQNLNPNEIILFQIKVPDLLLYDISSYHIFCGVENSFLYSAFFSSFTDDFLQLFKRKEFCDDIFTTKNGEIISAHKLILEFRIGSQIEEFRETITEKTIEEANQIFEIVYGNTKIESEELKNQIIEGFNIYIPMTESISEIYFEEKSKDLIILGKEKNITFDKLILIARSKLFRDKFLLMNEKEFKEYKEFKENIQISDKTIEIMKYWIYTNQIEEGTEINREVLQELNEANSYFQLNQSIPNLIDLANEIFNEMNEK